MISRLVSSLALLTCLLTAAPALAQKPSTITASAEAQKSIVRTARDHVPVWRRSPSLIIATLPQGLDLEALAKEGQWYQVQVPEKYAGAGGAVGFVFEGLVTLVAGPPPPTVAAAATADSKAAAARLPPPPAPVFRARGYGSLAYEWFLANDSFKAVLDQSGGLFYGAGGQAVFGHLFVDVGWEQFKKTGQRVVVANGQVFKLGIPDTITMQPLTISGGYRFPPEGQAVPYVGAGYTSLRFQETSKFATAEETTDKRFNGFVVLGGVEYAVHKWVFVSGEVRFASVPNAIGAPGVAGEFKESNLGGFSAMLKVAVGN